MHLSDERNGTMRKRPRVYVPSRGPDDWRSFLAKPDLHWRTGYSAKALAHSWESNDGLPDEIARLYDDPCELLIAIPEHKVPLPGGSRDSQNDVFALIRHGSQISAAAIEGKVDEAFGDNTVGEWLANASEGKQARMRYLCEVLGFDEVPEAHIRYQLLHRTASAVIEAARFNADEAAMIVHSFSPSRRWFEDFAAFALMFKILAQPDMAHIVTLKSGLKLRLGWATGNPAFLTV